MNRTQITPNCRLDGTRNLYVITKDGEKKYELRKVTPKEIFYLRKVGKPGFVLKLGDELFYAEVFWKIHLNFPINEFEDHLCGKCSKCRAVEDEFGGCKKVRDCSFENYMRSGSSEWNSLDLSKRIEKYDFIKAGYEIFNVKSEVFLVSECVKFSQIRQRPPIGFEEKLRLQYSLEKLYGAI